MPLLVRIRGNVQDGVMTRKTNCELACGVLITEYSFPDSQSAPYSNENRLGRSSGLSVQDHLSLLDLPANVSLALSAMARMLPRSFDPLRLNDSLRTFSLCSRASRSSLSEGVYLLAAPPVQKTVG